jgi:hypothetical protein
MPELGNQPKKNQAQRKETRHKEKRPRKIPRSHFFVLYNVHLHTLGQQKERELLNKETTKKRDLQLLIDTCGV